MTLSTGERLQRLIGGVTAIPTLPQVITRVNMMLTDSKTTVADVGNLIGEDPALTFKFLQVVNSPFYGFAKKIVQVSHAISILGFNTVRSLLYTTAVIRIFDTTKTQKTGFNLSGFWIHSLSVATVARFLAQYSGMQAEAEDLYVAGLLHDLGKVVLYQYDDDFVLVLKKCAEEGHRMVDTEKEILGFTHEDVGALLGARWNLPPKLVAAISKHHVPASAQVGGEYKKFVSAIHIADFICKMLETSGGDDYVPRLDSEAWKILGLSVKTVDLALCELRKQADGIKGLFAEANA